jgi:hypothetical protein
MIRPGSSQEVSTVANSLDAALVDGQNGLVPSGARSAMT